MPVIEIGEYSIEHIIKPRNKHAYLRFSQEGGLRLTSNGRIPMQELQAFIHSRRDWIESKRSETEQQVRITPGKDIMLYGKMESIAATPIDCKNEMTDAGLKRHYDSFYATESQRYLEPRIIQMAEVMQVKYNMIKYRKMKSRWGSCSEKGALTYNSLLIQLPPYLIEYVIVHELAHLIHFNHSRDFHTLVRRHLPDEKERRSALKRRQCLLY